MGLPEFPPGGARARQAENCAGQPIAFINRATAALVIRKTNTNAIEVALGVLNQATGPPAVRVAAGEGVDDIFRPAACLTAPIEKLRRKRRRSSQVIIAARSCCSVQISVMAHQQAVRISAIASSGEAVEDLLCPASL